MYQYQGIVKKIVDGDTIDVMLDLGFHCYRKVRCRLAGINAPEAKTEEGIKVTAFLTDLLLDKEVLVDSTKLDRYGRSIASITFDTMDVSACLHQTFPSVVLVKY